MDNSIKQTRGPCRLLFGHLLSGAVFASALFAGLLHAAGEVSEIQTSEQPGTPSRYTIDGTTYSWGMGKNQIMEGFTSHSTQFHFAGTADRVELIRHDVNNVTSGNPCGVFVERLGASSEVLKANYPSDGSDTGNCDMAAMLTSRVVNRGALDLFSNIGPTPKNVERVDYIYDHGVLAPLTTSALALSGHVVAEKSGNNPLKIAAITELDVFGQPAAYGPLVLVDRHGCSGDTICYGITNLRHNYSFFQNESTAPQGFAAYLRDTTESVGMAFVSHEALGVDAGDVYFGYSYFGDDVDEKIHTLTDVTTFPQDTDDEQILFGDSPDIYGGVAGYFLGDSLSVASGAVFKDENGDGLVDDNEAGISDIGLTLYEDTNGNGVFDPNTDKPIGPSFNTDVNGEFRIPGLEDGVYFLLLDEADADLPPAISVVPGSNPVMIVINGNDADGINFGFINDTVGTDGGSTDGTDAGTDSGSDTGSIDGGSDAGADAGEDSGSVDSGSDAGADSGSADSGTTTGGTDSGADTGGSDGETDGDLIIINDGDVKTMANLDSATVTQGSSVSIDVLANDTVATGQTVMIVSTSDSPNATIVINGDTITYTPEFGFTGMDSFLYVIEDSAGARSTSTVSVTVLRFSDINKNGLNDFDECNCDDLTIEVGVKGTALGTSSLLSLLLLTCLFGLRRYARSTRDGICGVLK